MVSDEREEVFMMHRCCVREVRRSEGIRGGFVRRGSELYLSLVYVRVWLSVEALRGCKCFCVLVNIFLLVLPEFVSGVRDMEERVARGLCGAFFGVFESGSLFRMQSWGSEVTEIFGRDLTRVEFRYSEAFDFKH